MDKNLKTVLNCLGIALLSLLIVNLVAFGVDMLQNGIGEQWAFRFKHGAFYADGRTSGLVFGSAEANLFLLMVFSVALYYQYKRGRIFTGQA